MPRPTTVKCEGCGADIPVAARGRIPIRCADCKNKPTTAPAAEPEWPKRIGPVTWQLEDGTVIHPGQPWPVEKQ